METKKKRVCQYGAKCYRKNQNHFKEFLHPSDLQSDSVTCRGGLHLIFITLKNVLNRYASHKEGVQRKEKFVHASDDGFNNFTENKASSNNQNQYEKGKHLQNIPVYNNDKRKCHETKKRSSEIQTGSDVDSKEGNYPKHTRKKLCTSNNDSKHLKEAREMFKVSTKEQKSSDDTDSESSEASDVKSNSWTYIKTSTKPKETQLVEDNKKEISKEELIKLYYLVEMPPDFYSFFQFCESHGPNEPLKALQPFGLTLVGPYDILAGKLTNDFDKELILCQWRYYYDPPEFQTVLASESGFHIGYWRDSPKDATTFMASNYECNGCMFEVQGENIFAAVYQYLVEFIKKCEPFCKMKAQKLQTNLGKWAKNNKYSLDKVTPRIRSRERKINSKTFHGVGIVVPVEKKTEVGYRPLIETDGNLKKICKLIINADTTSERETLMDRLQPLITAANIANDECDFGNSLELGIDLFCMGSPFFHDMIEHLLTTAYSLLNRSEFGEIIKVHLKNRKKLKNERS